MQARHAVLALALSLASCNKSDPKPAPAAGSGSGSAAVAVPSGTVRIFVDDQPVGQLAPDQLNLWPRFDTLVPLDARRMGMWQSIAVVRGSQDKPVVIERPSANHPELVPALFPGQGGASFGMFDPVELAKKGTPALREDGVTEVRLALAKGTGRGENDHAGGQSGGDPTKLELQIKAKAGNQTLTGEKLVSFDREPPPGDPDQPPGWKVTTLLERLGVAGYKRLLLTDAKGVSVTLEKQDLDPAKAVPFLKLNRQGVIRFRVYRKQGETWQATSDLRGVASIEVLE